MELSAEIVLSIIKSLQSDAACSPNEQRKEPRVGVRGHAVILLPDKSDLKPYPVTVRDISSKGIGLLTTERLLEIGDQFVMSLRAGQHGSRRELHYRVKRMNKVATNLYSVGAVLQKPGAQPATSNREAPAAATGSRMDVNAVRALEARLRKAME